VVRAQFDRDSLYNSSSRALGTLVVLMEGATPASAVRFYDVYFDTTGGFTPSVVTPAISYVDGVTFQGQESFQIVTPAATYYYTNPARALQDV